MGKDLLHRGLLGSVLIVGLLFATPIEAQSRSGFGGRPSSSTSRTNKPSQDKPSQDKPSKPSTSNPRPGSGASVGNSRPSSSSRPGGNSRPSDNHHYEPSVSTSRPSGNTRPSGNHHHGPSVSMSRPSGRPSWHRPHIPVVRPYRPIGRPLPRPVVPRYYHPYHGAPIISGVLGLTFGTAYERTLDYLYDRRYTIDGYTDNTVYLRDVTEMSYIWTDAILNYQYNRLSSAQFIFSTYYYDTYRFDRMYEILSYTYGSPVSSREIGNGASEVIWYGGNRKGMVSLEFYNDNGRYYTILSYGKN